MDDTANHIDQEAGREGFWTIFNDIDKLNYKGHHNNVSILDEMYKSIDQTLSSIVKWDQLWIENIA